MKEAFRATLSEDQKKALIKQRKKLGMRKMLRKEFTF